jgi:uncharacterized protein GlcG (DUF336 family)
MKRKSGFALLSSSLFALFFSAAAPAKAASIDCREPRLIPNAEVNTVVLSYSYAGREGTPLDGAAGQVTPIILYDALLSQLQYKSRNIAVINLTYPAPSTQESISACTPEAITRKLIGQLLPGHKLLFLWGNLYEDGGSISVQSFVSIHYREPSEAAGLDWRIGEKTFHFTAALPVDQVAFAPHEVPREAIEQLSSVYTNLTVAREQPNSDSKAGPIFDRQARPFAFSVDNVNGPWISLKALDGSSIGWIDVTTLNKQHPFRQYLPELDFIDAAVGYLHNGGSENSNVSFSLPLLDYMRSRLGVFAEKADRDRDVAALALKTWIDAIISSQQIDLLAVHAPQVSYSLLGHVLRNVNTDLRRSFREVVDLLPSSAQARNQKALVDLAGILEDSNESLQIVLDGFLDAVRLDPQDDRSLSNLETFYSALQYYDGPSASGMDRSDLAGRATEVSSIRDSLRAKTEQAHEHLLTAMLALEAAEAAITACKSQGYNVTVTIVDRTGTPKVVAIGDGASPLAVEVTRRKAYTSAMQRLSTEEFTKRVSTPGAFDPGIYDSQLITGQGGLPIKAGQDTIGDIAAAGAPGTDKDEACASAGLDKIKDRLK